jgi:hypothetical protein
MPSFVGQRTVDEDLHQLDCERYDQRGAGEEDSQSAEHQQHGRQDLKPLKGGDAGTDAATDGG